MAKAIYFDMDGTITDLYHVPDWENKLNNCDVSPYVDAMPLVDMDKLNSILDKFIAIGYIVGVISWCAMHGTKEYNRETRKAKKAWIKNNLPCVSEFHVVKYGTNKHTIANIRGSILVDDNAQVRRAWEQYSEENFTIDASDSKNLLKNLEKVLAMVA